jgi:hypothetical protein
VCWGWQGVGAVDLVCAVWAGLGIGARLSAANAYIGLGFFFFLLLQRAGFVSLSPVAGRLGIADCIAIVILALEDAQRCTPRFDSIMCVLPGPVAF